MKKIIYVSLAGSMEIEVWRLHDDFSLTLLQKIPTKGEPQPLLILNSKKCLYVGVRPNFRIYAYQIKSNGMLQELSYSILPGSPNHFEIDHTEKFLFSSSYHQNCISISPINSLGKPNSVIQIIKNIQGCHASKIDYKNTHLFVSSLRKNRIYLYNFIQETGILLTNKYKFLKTNENYGPRHLDFQKSNNRLFSINELNGSIDIWSIVYQRLHSIKILKNISIMSQNSSKKPWSSDLHISSCEKYIYASDRAENTISIIQLDENSTNIKKIGYVQTESQPRTFHINNTGENLMVVGEKSNNFSIYKISKKTGLLELKNICSTSGIRPVWISSITL